MSEAPLYVPGTWHRLSLRVEASLARCSARRCTPKRARLWHPGSRQASGSRQRPRSCGRCSPASPPGGQALRVPPEVLAVSPEVLAVCSARVQEEAPRAVTLVSLHVKLTGACTRQLLLFSQVRRPRKRLCLRPQTLHIEPRTCLARFSTGLHIVTCAHIASTCIDQHGAARGPYSTRPIGVNRSYFSATHRGRSELSLKWRTGECSL